ncbi:MAG: hypothetical protein M0D55_11910 [Elusimicrobiota bacterium]|nr:MAG: hypothetical protein M0D55_11910 [Elusimicrobiota bacterium]
MRLDDARRGLDAAAKALAALKREAGGEDAPPESEASASTRAALDAARRGIEERSRELEEARLRIAALEREREELLARAAGARPDPALAERARAPRARRRKCARRPWRRPPRSAGGCRSSRPSSCASPRSGARPRRPSSRAS